MIYLAPIQGFTDFIYRKAYDKAFPEIDAFFIPYISIKNEQILKKYETEILPENNLQKRVIPQVLAKDEVELLFLSNILKNYNYSEINLNLGCPYPMVTNRGKGAGLLPFPEKIKTLLDNFFEKSDLKLSVKLRAGLSEPTEIEQIITVLNEFPITEVIVHPRIASQLYKGEIIKSAFDFARENCKHKLVYNGDIFSLGNFQNKHQIFPDIKSWMLGRGILMNPFLPSEINGIFISNEEKQIKLKEFHLLIFEGYSEKMDNPGNVLNKMKQFWIYFSFNFPNQKKVFKQIKKTGSVDRYLSEVQNIFIKSGN